MYRKILLIGPMGAGKTSLGKRLAARLHWKFHDTDHEIVQCTGADIPLIFEREGEVGFRRREHQALKKVIEKPYDAVIACGGGIVLLPENRELLMQQAVVVFLDVSVERQLQRIGRDKNRPLAQAPDKRQRLQALRDERLGLYEGVSDIRLDTDANHFTVSFKRLLKSVREFIEMKEVSR